jgi:hypothetical protein
MAGTPHLFIVRADLRELIADAWLLPADRALNVSRSWSAARPPGLDLIDLPADWGHDGVRVARVPGEGRACWVGNVGRRGQPADWYAEVGRQFVRAAATELAGRAPATGRARPLLALPLVGTGFGGGAQISGEVTRALVRAAVEEAEAADVDVAIACWEPASHAAVQRARADLATADPGGAAAWPDLGLTLHARADDLGARARRGDLVLFLGAGVSMGAGLPSWDALIADLASVADIDPAQAEALGRLPAVDRARIVERRLGGSGLSLQEAVAGRMRVDGYPLVQALAAGLPVGEVVTMNYDQLFERASQGAGRPVAVLPWEPARSRDRWLLKMHGCVERGDIVLTRHDYHRYEHTRAALAGIVQALLITRHMLFLGFSLTDPNFHRIVDDVRRAVGPRPDDGDALGTAVVLHDDPLMDELWRDDVGLLPVADPGEADAAEAARRVEVLLDRVGAVATDEAAHLLDPSYAGLLDDRERWLADALLDLARPPAPGVTDTPAWAEVTALLRRFGHPAPPP